MTIKQIKNKILQKTYRASRKRSALEELSNSVNAAEAFLDRKVRKIRKGKM
ncbi:MAG: hypothetical protein LBL35_08845 [Clostridiales bacterium]|nr:hypothetical protein [Clostridiales bacterium]